MNGQEAWEAFLRERSAGAWEELVRGHIDLVYAAARRQTGGDAAMAEDVTQGVFLLLVEKAGKVRGPVAGWLLKATFYVCRDARKLARRRAHHERQAMMMRRETVMSAGGAKEEAMGGNGSWEVMGPWVDGAMLSLRAGDREVIVQRYLQGMSLRAVGEAMGIGEEAARKRVERAVGKLRKMLMRRAGVAATEGEGGVAGVLEKFGVQAAPIGLATAVKAGFGGAAKGTGAAVMAKVGAKALAVVHAKVAAAVGVAIVVAAGATVVGVRVVERGNVPVKEEAVVMSEPVASMSAATVAATQEAVVEKKEEALTVGEVQVVRWEVVLTEFGGEAVKQILKPVATKSEFYQANVCDGATLRQVVADQMIDGGVERTFTGIPFGQKYPNQAQLEMPSDLAFNCSDKDEKKTISMAGGSFEQDDKLERLGDGTLKVRLYRPKIDGTIAENYRWMIEKKKIPKSIFYEGNLQAGEAVAFLANYVTVSGAKYVHLIVWETFRAVPEQMATIHLETNSGWWCEHGPGELAAWADAARVWRAKAPVNRVVMPAFEKVLSDGKKLRLAGLSRPSQWPGCWWDAAGMPAVGVEEVPFEGDPPKGLFACVIMEWKGKHEGLIANPTEPIILPADLDPDDVVADSESMCQAIKENGDLEVGVLVGPWKTLGVLKMDKLQMWDGVKYTIRKTSSFSDHDFLAHFIREGVLDNEDILVPVDATGKMAKTNMGWPIIYGHRTEIRRVEDEPNYFDMALKDVAEWRVMRRKREWVTWSGFATEPKTTPETGVTGAMAKMSEDERAARVAAAEAEEIARKRREWAAVKADRTTVRGTIRALVDAVDAHDEEAVGKLLVATKPEAKRWVPHFAHELVVERKTREALERRMTPLPKNDAFYDLSGGSGFLVTDMAEELFDANWKPTKDGGMESEEFEMVKDAEGKYQLSVDKFVGEPGLEKNIQAEIEEAEELTAALNAGKGPLTMEGLKALLEPAATQGAATKP